MIPHSLKNDEIIHSGKPIPSVIDVDYLGEHRLYLEFDDGKHGTIDLAAYIDSIPALHVLSSPARFRQFSLSHGTLAWSHDLDISPRWLYDHLLAPAGGGALS